MNLRKAQTDPAVHPILSLDEDDHIYVRGSSVRNLAATFGTPCYVYDRQRIIENYNRALDAFARRIPRFHFHYALKANNNFHVAKTLIDCGCGVDAASPNEIELAIMLGVEPSDIIFTGNNVSDCDLRYALDKNVIINLDNAADLDRLLHYGKPQCLSFRINPGDISTYVKHRSPKLDFAGSQAKFGIMKDEVFGAYKAAKDAGTKLFGVHMMAGSRALNAEYFELNSRILLSIVGPVFKELGILPAFIDLGGGLGIPYHRDEHALDIEHTAQLVSDVLSEAMERYPLGDAKIIMEPARYFVGDAGILIGSVTSIKERSPEYHNDQRDKVIAGTDISMNVFARTILYGERHKLLVDGKVRHKTMTAGLCGQVCENTDYWLKHLDIPYTIARNDLVVFTDVGAYGYAMSYGYNGRLRPCEVILDEGQAMLIRRKETFEDMISTMLT